MSRPVLDQDTHPWRDASRSVAERVADLLGRMTLAEKAAQLTSLWLGHQPRDSQVAPMQGELRAPEAPLAELIGDGLGQLTRVFGTRPVPPRDAVGTLRELQSQIVAASRFGIPAVAHEECLTGFAAWTATIFPTPLAWGASFDPELVRETGAAIGTSMRTLGAHQGLAPVLDVIRDPRWGRVDECIGEDPYLVGTIGTAYVQGLQDEGVHATLKHFLGYSASAAGRNHAPVHVGPRELADVFLPPFEMALLDGGARSVMNSYGAIDGVPVGADPELLTRVLREQLGFTGVVVSDYFSVGFLQVMQGIAADRGEAAALALVAGIDVELPAGDAYLTPLAELVRSGAVDEAYVDRAVLRVLAQKEELGLLEPDAFAGEPPTEVDLNPPEHREIALRLATESVVLLANDRVLPLGASTPVRRIAVVGPNADRAEALQGCYSFANHVLPGFPEYPIGIPMPTVAEGLASAFAAAGGPQPEFVLAQGCEVEGNDTSGFAAAAEAVEGSDVAVVVVGDQAGLFGRGTVGEGNDTATLELPGVQRALVEALVATGTPVVLVLLTGRPYAIGWALDGDGPRPAAALQAFFPGEAGGLAIGNILAGTSNPSGRLPVSLPRSAGAQPYSYLQPTLGGPSEVTSADPTPVRPFGFGLSYTTFGYTDLVVDTDAVAGGSFAASVTVTNTGAVAGTDVVQLYGRDLHGSVVRPVAQLLGYTRVTLGPGESSRVLFDVPTTRFAFADRRLVRVVEPGDVDVWVGSHAGASAEGMPSVEATNGAISNHGLRIVAHRGGRDPAGPAVHHRGRARGHHRRCTPRDRSRRGPRPERMTVVRNPILPGCHPDPSICRVGDDYYLVTSTFEYFPGLPVFHSTDLARWECIGPVVTRSDQLDYAGIASSGGLYAPTIRHNDGRFYVVCTLVDQADPDRGGNFAMSASDPAGPWSGPHWLDADGIDPSLFFDDDGRAWLHGTRPARTPAWHDQTEVWVREFDPGTMALVGPEQVIWSGALLGAVWAEGPHLYKVAGTYYLLAAEGGTEFHHAVSVARSDSVTGPYAGNPANPVLTHRHLGRSADIVGTGHADLVQAVDGSWWAVLLAMRPYGGYHYPLGRETFLVPVTWEDGWPVFAPGAGRVPAEVEVPFASGGPVLAGDAGWTSLRGPASAFAEPDGDGWRLRLQPASLADPGTPSFLGVRQRHRDLDVEVTLRGILRPGEEAGVAVRQSERDHVRLALVPAGGSVLARATQRRAGTDVLLGELALEPVDRVRVGVRVRGQEYALWVRVGDRDVVVATADGRTLDSVATGGFLGLWLGVYGTSNGSPSDTVIAVEGFAYRPAGPTVN